MNAAAHPIPESIKPSSEGTRVWWLGMVGALSAGTLAKLSTVAFPAMELGLFARVAACLAGVLTGSPVARVETGWSIPAGGVPIIVTQACSAAAYFWIVAACLGWQLGQSGAKDKKWRGLTRLLAAPLIAVPVTLLVNALRIVAVAQMHRWVIPHFPKSYAAFLHLLTGVAVFLPALIALNLLLEAYGSRHSSIN